MVLPVTERQIEILSDFSDDELTRYLAEGRRRIANDRVVLNIGDLLENIEMVESELERRQGLMRVGVAF